MVKINLTRDIINLLPQIHVQRTENGVEIISKELYNQMGVVESYAIANGHYEDHIPGSELSKEGKQWSAEVNEKAWEAYTYIVDNLRDIMDIVLYYSVEGRLKEGSYKRFERECIWNYSPFPDC